MGWIQLNWITFCDIESSSPDSQCHPPHSMYVHSSTFSMISARTTLSLPSFFPHPMVLIHQCWSEITTSFVLLYFCAYIQLVFFSEKSTSFDLMNSNNNNNNNIVKLVQIWYLLHRVWWRLNETIHARCLEHYQILVLNNYWLLKVKILTLQKRSTPIASSSIVKRNPISETLTYIFVISLWKKMFIIF